MSDAKRPSSKTGLKRKYHSKSKKGCVTCKKRRVKCDEAKPACFNCVRMKLECGYLEDGDASAPKKQKKTDAETSSSTSQTQQATPIKSPSPSPSNNKAFLADMATMGNSLLGAGNLNNINMSHLVNNLSNLRDFSALGEIPNLGSLAALAQQPLDLGSLGSLGSQLSSIGFNLDSLVTPLLKSKTDPATSLNPPNPAAGLSAVIDSAILHLTGHEPLAMAALEMKSANAPTLPELAELASTIPVMTDSLPNPASHMQSMPTNQQSPDATSALNMVDLKLMYHYTTHVSRTITGAGISDTDIWNNDIPMLAFEYPFLMHALLAFSATHLSRTESGLDACVTQHRGDALRLLREAILNIDSDNTDALVASALILIMDSLANASVPSLTSTKSLPASAWIFHVKGAATILTAVWPLTEASRFYKFISVDLGDLGDIINEKSQLTRNNPLMYADLECHDSSIADLFPVPINSPYLITLAYLNKLHKERYKADFILRIFAFPALLEKEFLGLLMVGDVKAMRIMQSYYKLLRSFTMEMKDKVWFLEGVSSVLPVDVEEYAGGAGGMHMMLDFLGGGPSIMEDNEVDKDLSMIDPGGQMAKKLIDTNNLPSDITSALDVMQGEGGILNHD